jgi:VanZ family protein
MKRHPRLTTTAAIFASTLFVSFLLFYDFGKSSSRIIQTLTSYGHVPLFGFIALGVLWLMSGGNYRNCGKKLYVQAGIINVLLGTLTEIIQIWTPSRTFRFGDILSDAVGGTAFLVFLYSYRQGIGRRGKIALRALALSGLIVMGHSIITATLDTIQMAYEAPLLGSFENRLEMSRWHENESTIKRTRLHAAHGEYALEVNLSPGVFPGVSLVHLIPDWRNYSTLSFDVFLTGTSPLPLTVRINDIKHNEDYDDRYNRTFVLAPNRNHITIDLEEVRKSPRGREMNMAHMRLICLFSHNLKESRQIYLDHFILKNPTRNQQQDRR